MDLLRQLKRRDNIDIILLSARLLRTVRHLTPRQLFYRLKYGLGLVGKTRPFSVSWINCSLRIPCVQVSPCKRFLGQGRFRFINIDGELKKGWNNTEYPKLWLYQLHYHEWLFDDACDAELWIKRWIHENPSFSGKIDQTASTK